MYYLPKKYTEGPIRAPLQRCPVPCETLQGILLGCSSAQLCSSCFISVNSPRIIRGIANSSKCQSMGSRTKPKSSSSLYRKGHQNWEIALLKLPDQLQSSSSCVYIWRCSLKLYSLFLVPFLLLRAPNSFLTAESCSSLSHPLFLLPYAQHPTEPW